MKKIIVLSFLIILGLLLVSCNKKEEEEEIVEKNIIVNGESEYKFLCGLDSSRDVIYGLKTLTNKITEKTGYKITCLRDNFESENRKEVLVGLTNREESIAVYNSLEENSYAIKIVNDSIVIAGSDNAYLMLALYEFENTFINNSEYCNTGYLKVVSDKCVNKQIEGGLTVNKIISLGYKPYASIEKFITVNAIGDIKVGQGACTDGEYFYFILRDSADSKAIIFQYDMNGEFVKQSEEIYLGHGNDLTYDSDRDCLICAHGVSESNTYSYINKETLTVTSSFTVESKGGGGSITYNSKLKRFATSKGGETLSFYDNDFNYIKTIDREVVSYTAQGLGSDEDYIYAPMSGSSDNLIVTYDWEGNFICNITVETSAESETFLYYDGNYYLNFYVPGVGAVLYKLLFTVKYE